MKLKLLIWSALFLFSLPGFAQTSWLDCERFLALPKIFFSISPPGASHGAVIASPTPRYFFHWIRDAALVIDTLITRYELTSDPQEKDIITKKITEYIEFSRRIQHTYVEPQFGDPRYNLGEAKVNVDGSGYNDFWGRPQNDGPALRAASIIRWAQILLREGKEDFVRENLYSANFQAESVIKKDLEYVSHHWRDPSFDLWEEVKGDHFYTRMVQRKALIQGAKLAETLGDPDAAAWYRRQADEITTSIQHFWSPENGYILATINRTEGQPQKTSHLDIAVILGLLHGSLDDGLFNFRDDKVQATMTKLEDVFSSIYSVNKLGPGVAIGRYPEDLYEGGHPWVLATLAMAEAYYKMAREYFLLNELSKAEQLIAKGDTFVARVQRHAYPNGNLSEQIHRDTGVMTSVEDLTWNYSAIITTQWARTQALQK